MKRSTKGLGSITQLPTGVWRVKVPVGRTPSGATRYRTKHCATKSDARNWQRQLISLREQQQLVAGPQTTFRAFATEYLLTPSDHVRERTHDQYYRNLRNHVFPTLGGRALHDIRPWDIEALLKQLRKSRSASTVNNVRIAMSKVFRVAERHELVLSNPVRRTEKARRNEFEPTQVKLPWSREEAQSVLKCAEGTQIELFIVLVLSTGMRRGEALGLRWSDIDFDAGTVSIERSVHRESIIQKDGSKISRIAVTPPKTAQSRRVNQLTLPVIDVLRRHQLEQHLQGLNQSQSIDGDQYVFTNSVGGLLDESKLSRRFKKFCIENGIRDIRPHDMRHTFATILIDDDARNIGAVSKALGHSSSSITLDIYGKTAKVESQAINRMGELLFPDRAITAISSPTVPVQFVHSSKRFKDVG